MGQAVRRRRNRCDFREPVFERAFDEDNKNDWRSSSLRRELNGAFLDALVAEGADRAAFLDWESDLTADDGMTDYGTATDKIALLSDKLYRMFRGIIPRVDAWCWNLTPWTCDPEYSYIVRSVGSSGAMGWRYAYVGDSGVDMQTGQNAGLFTAGVTWGFRDEKELEENGADTLVHNAEELENLIL